MTAAEILDFYARQNIRLVYWPQIGDNKGPRADKWPEIIYTPADYHDGYRVGIITGHEVSAGKFLHDVDIDWSDGSAIAQAILPHTDLIYGRTSKTVSHCWYTVSDALPSFKYEDIDKTCLIELRGTKLDGTLGMQSMAPPSMWSKDGAKEPLAFVRMVGPAHLDTPSLLKQRVCMTAIAMLCAKHFGVHGFGHEVRLMWAGFLLRAGLSVDEIVTMGVAISAYCDNREVHDVRLSVESTHKRLEAKERKVKGGPALAKHLGDKGKAFLKRINEWLGRESDFLRDSEGRIQAESQENIRRALDQLTVELKYNEFSDKMTINGAPLEDRELNDLWLRVDEECKFRPSFLFFEKVIKRMAWGNSFHPVRDYFSTLTWDGTPRIASWLIDAAGAARSPFVEAVSAIVLIGAVKRIVSPGCKHDELLVLESKQGLNKSSGLRALCPNPDWFSDDFELNLSSQRMIEATLGKWIIEVGELSGMRPATSEQLKATLSRQSDGPARMAYARLPMERLRQFILFGTTNSKAYLADPTGGRRFWPVPIGEFDIAWILRHRDQLWAEAVTLVAAGASNRLQKELWPVASDHQEARREIDPWEAPIRNALIVTEAFHRYGDHKTRVVTTALWDALEIPIDRRDRKGQIRLSEIMQRLGFERTRVRPAGELVQVGYCSTMTHWIDAQAENIGHVTGDLLADVDTPAVSASREPGDDDIPF